MAEYFEERESAEKFMHEWHTKDGSSPVQFAKILNHGCEKWIVNYDSGQSIYGSQFIKVLENCSSEIGTILRTPWPDRQRILQMERLRAEQRRKAQLEMEERHRKEEKRVNEIMQRRRADGTCPMCGLPFGFVDRLLRRSKHGDCKGFQESGRTLV